jgi:hypothetical protein
MGCSWHDVRRLWAALGSYPNVNFISVRHIHGVFDGGEFP